MAVFITDEDRAIWERFQPEGLRWAYAKSQVLEGTLMVAVLRVDTEYRHWLRATWGMPWEQQIEVLNG